MVKKESYGPVQGLHIGNKLAGIFAPPMTVRCYAVDGLLVDAGLRTKRGDILQFADENRVQKVAITHYHEDHCGAVDTLKKSGKAVFASQKTKRYLKRPFEMRFYEHLIWGKPEQTQAEDYPHTIPTANHVFEVIDAPGHCEDQVVLFEKNQGWLFSGDVFLHENVKLFRSDEDFRQTITTLEKLVELDFDSLYCAHNPRPTGGRLALRKKLQYLKDVEGQVRDLHAKGVPMKRIAREVIGKERWSLYLVTGMDVSSFNIVRSILKGPVLRRDARSFESAPEPLTRRIPFRGLKDGVDSEKDQLK